jgi:ORF6N domain-containing protein
MTKSAPVPVERIERAILILRGHKVMLDNDLAALYGVETRALVQAVKRNPERFPKDFMFQLTNQELTAWRSQIVMSNPGAKMGLRRPPFAFTEHGALMAATVLNSPRAVEMSVYVVRAFVRMREVLTTHRELARKLAALERRIDTHDETIAEILAAIRQLMAPPEPRKKRPIGFVTPEEET